jgi:hypothetical protein
MPEHQFLHGSGRYRASRIPNAGRDPLELIDSSRSQITATVVEGAGMAFVTVRPMTQDSA